MESRNEERQWKAIAEFFLNEFVYIKQIHQVSALLQKRKTPSYLVKPYRNEDVASNKMIQENPKIKEMFDLMDKIAKQVHWKPDKFMANLAAKEKFNEVFLTELRDKLFENDIEHAAVTLMYAIYCRVEPDGKGLDIYAGANFVQPIISKSLPKLREIGEDDDYLSQGLILPTQRYPRYRMKLEEVAKLFNEKDIKTDIDDALDEAKQFISKGNEQMRGVILLMLIDYLATMESEPNVQFKEKEKVFKKIIYLIAELADKEEEPENKKDIIIDTIQEAIHKLKMPFGENQFVFLLGKLIEECNKNIDDVFFRGKRIYENYGKTLDPIVKDFEIFDVDDASESAPSAHLDTPYTLFSTASSELGEVDEDEKDQVNKEEEKREMKTPEYLQAAYDYFEQYKDKNKTDYKDRHAHFTKLENMISKNIDKNKIDDFIKNGIKDFSPQFEISSKLGISSKRYADILRDIRVHLHVGERISPKRQT